MTPPEDWNDQDPGRNREAQFVRIVMWSLIAALVTGVVTFLIMQEDDEDPDRPPIIIRNGSVIIGVEGNDPGELKKIQDRRTWYHDHANQGPKRLNAFVVGIANNTCGSGSTHFVSNIKKAIVYYSRGADARQVELLNRGNRVEIDVVSGPDPTNVNAWTLTFDAETARLTRVMFEMPSGNVTCDLDAGGRILITQHK
jgi:hypothetical protein